MLRSFVFVNRMNQSVAGMDRNTNRLALPYLFLNAA